MGKKYEDYNELFCKHLCEEVKKFEECPNMEHLKKVKDLVEVINGLNEMEMDEAVRKMAERYGYDSETRTFHSDDCMPYYGGEMEFLEMFNASRGRGGRGGTRRRRDSRGRYMAYTPRTIYNPPMPDEDMEPREYPYYMNDGKDMKRTDRNETKREYSGERRKTDRGGYPNGSDMDDDGMYMLRQYDGRPSMTPYNMSHDVPKKLTEQDMEEWMDKLENFDGSDGPKWSKAQIEAEAKRAGIDVNKYGLPTLWTCANMLYSDFGGVAEKFNISKPSFYLHLAMAFLDDPDFQGSNGGKEKLSLYYHEIACAD